MGSWEGRGGVHPEPEDCVLGHREARNSRGLVVFSVSSSWGVLLGYKEIPLWFEASWPR